MENITDTTPSHDANRVRKAASLTISALKEFTSRTGIEVNAVKPREVGALEQRVYAVVANWDIGNVPLQIHQLALTTGIKIAYCAYSHTPLDVQVHIALYSFLLFIVDDLTVPHTALEEFMGRFYSKSPQLHPILDILVDNILHMKNYFLPFPTKLILRSTVDYLNMMAFEHETQNMTFRPAALSYVRMKRLHNGISDTYVCFIFDKFAFPDVSSYIQVLPEAAIFISYANDVFSFYKEEIAQEAANFVHDRAALTGKDVETSLMDITNELVDSAAKSRLILDGESEKRTWERFMAGYVAFHLISPRYRLRDILSTNEC